MQVNAVNIDGRDEKRTYFCSSLSREHGGGLRFQN